MTPATRAFLLAACAAVGFALATRPTSWGPLVFLAATLLHEAVRRTDRRATAAAVTAVVAIGPASVAMTALAPLRPAAAVAGLVTIAASFAVVGAVAHDGRVPAQRRRGWWRRAAQPTAVALVWCGVEAAWGSPLLMGRYALPVLSVGSALADGPLRAVAAWPSAAWPGASWADASWAGASFAGTASLSALVLGAGGLASATLPAPAHPSAADARQRFRPSAVARGSAAALLLVGLSVAALPRDPLDAKPGEVVPVVARGEQVLRLRLVQHVPTPQAIAASGFDARVRARASAPLVAALDESDGRLVVWPEASWPRPIGVDDSALASAPRAEPASAVTEELPWDTAVLFGAATVDGAALRNSVLLAEGDRLDAVAAKVRLVPITEDRLVGGDAGATFSWNGIVLAAAVCWDAAFPGVARAAARAKARALIYLASDAYAGDGPVGRLHLRQARLRAVETGLPVVFVQATGPSAAIDASGRVLALLPAGVRGHLDVDLPLFTPPFGSKGGGG